MRLRQGSTWMARCVLPSALLFLALLGTISARGESVVTGYFLGWVLCVSMLTISPIDAVLLANADALPPPPPPPLPPKITEQAKQNTFAYHTQGASNSSTFTTNSSALSSNTTAVVNSTAVSSTAVANSTAATNNTAANSTGSVFVGGGLGELGVQDLTDNSTEFLYSNISGVVILPETPTPAPAPAPLAAHLSSQQLNSTNGESSQDSLLYVYMLKTYFMAYAVGWHLVDGYVHPGMAEPPASDMAGGSILSSLLGNNSSADGPADGGYYLTESLDGQPVLVTSNPDAPIAWAAPIFVAFLVILVAGVGVYIYRQRRRATAAKRYVNVNFEGSLEMPPLQPKPGQKIAQV